MSLSPVAFILLYIVLPIFILSCIISCIVIVALTITYVLIRKFGTSPTTFPQSIYKKELYSKLIDEQDGMETVNFNNGEGISVTKEDLELYRKTIELPSMLVNEEDFVNESTEEENTIEIKEEDKKDEKKEVIVEKEVEVEKKEVVETKKEDEEEEGEVIQKKDEMFIVVKNFQKNAFVEKVKDQSGKVPRELIRSLVMGEIVQLTPHEETDTFDGKWLWGRKTSGAEGYFPSEVVKGMSTFKKKKKKKKEEDMKNKGGRSRRKKRFYNVYDKKKRVDW